MNFNKTLNSCAKLGPTFLAFAFLLANSCSTSKTQIDCSLYKTGNFRFTPKDGYGEYVFRIARTDSLQTETDQKSGYTKLSIHWTSNCTYETTVLESSYKFSIEIEKNRRTIPLKTEILSGTKDYYVFRSTREKSNVILTDTMWIVR